MDRDETVKIMLADGNEIYARVASLGGEEDVSSRTYKFEDAVDVIKAIAGQLKEAMDSIKPDGASVEFKVKLSGGSGKLTALLVNIEGEASIKVTLKWGGK